MQTSDRQPFADQLAQVYSVYPGAVLNPSAMTAFWGTLEPYSLESVIGALNYHIGDHEGRGTWPPTPADVKKILDVTFPAIVRQRVNRILQKAREDCEQWREKIAIANVELGMNLIDLRAAESRIRGYEHEIQIVMCSDAVQQAIRGARAYDVRTQHIAPPTAIRRAINGLVAAFGGKRP